jgi:putative oxidoreductase
MSYEITLPLFVRGETVQMFEQKLAGSPVPAKVAAYAVVYGEFVLPILLLVGLGTRFAALALIGLTVFFDQVLAPGSFWTLHIYWYAILLVLLSCGPGIISFDYLVRRAYERDA